MRPFAPAFRSLEPTRQTYLVRRVALVAMVATLMATTMAAVSSLADRSGATVSAETTTSQELQAVAATEADTAALSENHPQPAPEAATETLTSPEELLPARASRFVDLGPERLLDTRDLDASPPAPDSTMTVTVPADQSALALSISAIEAARAGSVFVDGGAGITEAMALQSGATGSNLIIVPVLGSEVTFTTTSGGHLVVDLVGTFEPSAATRTGRFVAVSPDRIATLDNAIDGTDADLAFGRAVGAGVSAVLVSISGEVGGDGGIVRIGKQADAYDQMMMWSPAVGDSRVRHGLALIQPTDNFVAALRYEGGRSLTVDVLGYFTDEYAEPSTSGLFVPSGPRALFTGELIAGTPMEAGGLEPLASSAMVIVGSSDAVGVGLGSTLLPVREGTVTITAASGLDARVTLLGVFL